MLAASTFSQGVFSIYAWLLQMLQEHFQLVRTMKESARGSITLIRHTATNQSFVLRRFRGSAEVYRKLLDYCEAHSLEIISDSYEFCINDYLTTHDENEYITKIMFYVRSS